MPYKRVPKSFKPGGWLDLVGFFWCAREYERHPVEDVCRLYEAAFGKSVTVGQMRAAASNHGWKSKKRGSRMVSRKWSDEELGWLEQYMPTMPRAELKALYEKEWERPITLAQLDNLCTRYGWQGAPNTGRFVPGDPRSGVHTTEQRNAFLEGGKATRFKNGHNSNHEFPMYAERWRIVGSQKVRVLFIKVPGPDPYRRDFPSHEKYHWIRKAVWVWEQAHGPVPEGHAVVQLDGDAANCELENLDCVERGVLAIMNRHGPEYAGPEANPARVRLAQLKHQLGERGRSMNEATNGKEN